MTSLTPKEAREVHKLNRFASQSPQCLPSGSRELIRQLYRLNYFYPSKKKRVKIPRTWRWDYAEPEGTLQTTTRSVREWFTRPDALKAPEALLRPPSPTPLPQLRSPLYSILPTEIREYIFKLVVTSYPEDEYHYPNITPAITSVCRLTRQKMLQLFFKHNHFAFPTQKQFTEIAIKDPIKWLYAMRPHLQKIHQITFFVGCIAIIDGYSFWGPVSVTIKHDPAQGCWKTTCEDDWSIEKPNTGKITPDERKALESEGNLLCGLMRTMVEGRSRADLTPEYLIWLMHDARIVYATEKMERSFDGMGMYPGVNTLGPDIVRPPDMYSTHIEYDQIVRCPIDDTAWQLPKVP
jgi:hypothetical protein